MSRFTELFEESTPAPEPAKVEKVAKVKTGKVIKAPNKKFTMD